MMFGSSGGKEPSFKEVELRPAIHLAFDELEFRDLALDRTIRPRLLDRSRNRHLVRADTGCKGRDQPRCRVLDPALKVVSPHTDHHVEPVHERAPAWCRGQGCECTDPNPGPNYA